MNVGKPEIWLTLGGDNPLTVSLSPLPSESNDLQQNWKGVELFYIDMNMMTTFVTATKSQVTRDTNNFCDRVYLISPSQVD